MSDWEIFVEPPGEWIVLPTGDGFSAEDFAAEQVAWLPDDSARADLAHQLVTFTRRAQDLRAVVAGCLPTDSWSDVYAYLEILLAPTDAEGLPTDLDQLAAALRPEGDTWAEVSRVTVPAGEAVRVHLIDADEAPPEQEAVVESITVAVPAPDEQLVGLLTVSWTDLAHAEELIELVDETAQTLRFEPPQD